MKVQKKNGGYAAQVTLPVTGKRTWVTGRTEAEVVGRSEALRAMGRNVRAGLVDPQDALLQVDRATSGPVSLAQAYEIHLQGKEGNSRRFLLAAWRNWMAPYLGELLVIQLTAEVMADWAEALLKGSGRLAARAEARGTKRRRIAKSSLFAAYTQLRAMVARQVKRRRVRELPWYDWKPPMPDKARREAPRTGQEIAKLLEAVLERDAELDRAWPRTLHDLAARVGVAVLCGLRQGELAGLAWSALRPELDEHGAPTGELILEVRVQADTGWRKRYPNAKEPQSPPKWSTTRRQIVHRIAVVFLLRQRARLEELGLYKPDGPVFPARAGPYRGGWRNQPRAIGIVEELRPAWVRAGLPNEGRLVAHGLRHGFGTAEARAFGGDYRSLMSRLGHKNFRSTLVYLEEADRTELPRAKAQVPELPALARIAADYRDLHARMAAAPRALAGPAQAPEPILARHEEAAATLPATPKAELKGIDFEAALSAWQAAGRSGERPAEVTHHAERARTRAYARARRSGLDNEAAAAAGREAKGRVLGAWATFVARKTEGRAA